MRRLKVVVTEDIDRGCIDFEMYDKLKSSIGLYNIDCIIEDYNMSDSEIRQYINNSKLLTKVYNIILNEKLQDKIDPKALVLLDKSGVDTIEKYIIYIIELLDWHDMFGDNINITEAIVIILTEGIYTDKGVDYIINNIILSMRLNYSILGLKLLKENL